MAENGCATRGKGDKPVVETDAVQGEHMNILDATRCIFDWGKLYQVDIL
jgi:hypothetical protein